MIRTSGFWLRAGSPQAQRIQIARTMNLSGKRGLARRLAGLEKEEEDRG